MLPRELLCLKKVTLFSPLNSRNTFFVTYVMDIAYFVSVFIFVEKEQTKMEKKQLHLQTDSKVF